MFTALTNKQRLRSLFGWMYRLVRNLADVVLKADRRFLLLTPSLLKTQCIYDREQKRLIKLQIRDLTDFAVIHQVYVRHDYDFGKSDKARALDAYYRDIVKSGRIPLIVDCGGNSGMAARYFRETYSEAFVVCVEPDPSNLEAAKMNNDSAGVACLLAGVGSVDGRAMIQDPGLGNWGYRVEACENGNLDLISINSILRQYAPARFTPFIIKIDIEGFEGNLFESNTEWFDLFPMLVIELHDWLFPGQANSKNFLREVSRRNRDFVFRGENVFTVSNDLIQ